MCAWASAFHAIVRPWAAIFPVGKVPPSVVSTSMRLERPTPPAMAGVHTPVCAPFESLPWGSAAEQECGNVVAVEGVGADDAQLHQRPDISEAVDGC